MIVQKYFAALISITIVVLSALTAIPSGRLDGAAAIQLASLGISAVVTYISPLVNISWKGIIKTGAAAIAAVFSILYPIVATHGTPTPLQVTLMVVAILNTIGVEVGVQIRTDTATLASEAAPSTSAISNTDFASIAHIAANASASAAAAAVTQANILPFGAPQAFGKPSAEPEPVVEPELAPEEIPTQPVETAPNPANRVDDTTSINAANLVSD